MKNTIIKVYMQYPLKTSDSQYYKSIISNPPENIKYVSETKKLGMITDKKMFNVRSFLKKYSTLIVQLLGISIPNLWETRTSEKYDLIHCAHCLSKNDSPWVADFEGIWQMWIFGQKSGRTLEKIRKILLSKNCKKIIAWTETSKKEILNEFPEIGDKIEVVHYAMPYPKLAKRAKNINKITLLHISRYFYNKGGLHAIEAMDILTKKYKNVEAIFISDIPKEVSERYSKNKKIRVMGLTSYDTIIKEIYPNSDIFVYPGYSDSFGFAFPEALAFGLPVVTVDGFARKDIINDGKTGYVIERPKDVSIDKMGEIEKKIIQRMVDKTSILIENKNLRERMSRAGREMVKKGKYSIRERNKRLRKIYEEALK